MDQHGLAWKKCPWHRHWKQVEKLYVCFNPLLLLPGVLNRGTSAVWTRLTLGGGGCPVPCRRLCSTLAPAYEMPAAPSPTIKTANNASGHCQGSPWSGSRGQNFPWLRLNGLKEWFIDTLCLYTTGKSLEGCPLSCSLLGTRVGPEKQCSLFILHLSTA